MTIFILFCVVFLLPTGYYVAYPGQPTNLSLYVTSEKTINTGSFYIVPVNLDSNDLTAKLFSTSSINSNLLSVLRAKIYGNAEIEKLKTYIPTNMAETELRVFETEITQKSELASLTAALNYLNIKYNMSEDVFVNNSIISYIGKVPLRIDLKKIKGSSGGVMLSLELISRLSNKDLTHGYKIAGSGRITPEGQIYPVSQVSLKIEAAQNEGMDYFIISKNQMSDIDPKCFSNIQIVPVNNLNDAMDFLSTLNTV